MITAKNKSTHPGMKNLIPSSQRSPEQLREMGHKGGLKSAENRKRRKDIAEALKMLLAEEDKDGVLIQDKIVTKCLESLIENGNVKDLKTLTEILGENVIKMEVNTPQIVVEEKDASMVADLMGQNEESEE